LALADSPAKGDEWHFVEILAGHQLGKLNIQIVHIMQQSTENSKHLTEIAVSSRVAFGRFECF
jgi:hypothetical protein